MKLTVALIALPLLLAGCGTADIQTVAVATQLTDTTSKPVIPAECRVSDRSPFPTVAEPKDGMEVKEFFHKAALKAQTRDAKNSLREQRCECWTVDQLGSSDDKKRLADTCKSVRPPDVPDAAKSAKPEAAKAVKPVPKA